MMLVAGLASRSVPAFSSSRMEPPRKPLFAAVHNSANDGSASSEAGGAGHS